MAITLKIPTARRGGQSGKGRGKSRFLAGDPIVRIALLCFLSASLIVIGFFTYWYVKYDRIIEQRFRGPAFATSAKIYASPVVVRVGSKYTVPDIAADLRRAGYTDADSGSHASGSKAGSAGIAESPLGSYREHGGKVEVMPGPESYHSPEPATITVANGVVSEVVSRSAGDLEAYELEPEPVTSLFDAGDRSKRE